MHSSIKLSASSPQRFWEITVLHEDACLLALDKPTGILTSSDPDDPTAPSLMQLIHESVRQGKSWVLARGLSHLVAVHRPEAEATGVLLLAKTKSAQISLANQLGAECPLMTVLALACGSAAEDEFEVDAPLAPFPNRPGVMRVDPRTGKKARTRFRVIERFLGNTLLHCEPLTHRNHQIRVHLRHLGLPVAGDRAYGGQAVLLSRLKPGYRFKANRDEIPLMGRCALHVESVTIKHPDSGLPLTITSPQPKDLLVTLKYLRRYAAPIPSRSDVTDETGQDTTERETSHLE